jgi:hypothetical protein
MTRTGWTLGASVGLLAAAILAGSGLADHPLLAAERPGPQVLRDPATLLVDANDPGAFATIQAAADAAVDGDTILIAPGLYPEAVTIEGVSELTLRGLGTEPGNVAIWGGAAGPACEDWLDVGIHAIGARNVTIENVAAIEFRSHGFFWDNVEGFYGRNLLAANGCIYGILTHDSEIGEIAFSEAFGGGDSGIYTGEAANCRCVLHHNNVHDNMIGYSGTKGNHVTIRDSWYHDNAVGILPNTLTPDVVHYVTEHVGLGKDAILQCCITIVDNLIENNNNANVVPHGFTETFHLPVGTGIELAGASGNIVADNVIRGNDRWGVAIHWLFAVPNGNVVHDNAFEDNGLDVWWDEWGAGNCFSNNVAEGGAPVTSDPSPLPDCGPLPSAGVPNAEKDARLAVLALGHNAGVEELPEA